MQGATGAAAKPVKGGKRVKKAQEPQPTNEQMNPDGQPDIPGTTQAELKERLTVKAMTVGDVELRAIEPGVLYEHKAGQPSLTCLSSVEEAHACMLHVDAVGRLNVVLYATQLRTGSFGLGWPTLVNKAMQKLSMVLQTMTHPSHSLSCPSMKSSPAPVISTNSRCLMQSYLPTSSTSHAPFLWQGTGRSKLIVRVSL